MAGLQRSAVSFRRQGSSGLVWEDKLFVSGELNRKDHETQTTQQQQETEGQQEVKDKDIPKKAASSRTSTGFIERSLSNGGGYRTGRVSPAIEPPSPKVSACGFCKSFGNKQENNNNNSRRRPPTKSGKRKM